MSDENATDTVTVKWGGVDVVVEMAPVRCADDSGFVVGLARGKVGNVVLDHRDHARWSPDWDARIDFPDEVDGDDDRA